LCAREVSHKTDNFYALCKKNPQEIDNFSTIFFIFLHMAYKMSVFAETILRACKMSKYTGEIIFSICLTFLNTFKMQFK
jgi:hypothetical protein